MSMKFEYDPAKSAANKAKHGLDFKEAKALWKDENAGGSRAAHRAFFWSLAALGQKIWTGVVTYRGNAVRIISVRRARKDEVEHYGS